MASARRAIRSPRPMISCAWRVSRRARTSPRPRSTTAATALINAKQWQRAIEVLQAYRREYPNGQYSADVGRKLAVAYTAAGQAGAAAAEFERIAADPGERPGRGARGAGPGRRSVSAVGRPHARAWRCCERVVRDFPTPIADAIELRQRLADIATQAAVELERAHYWQREIVSRRCRGRRRAHRSHTLSGRAGAAGAGRAGAR